MEYIDDSEWLTHRNSNCFCSAVAGDMADHLGRMATTYLMVRLQRLSGTIIFQSIQGHFVTLRGKLQ